MPDGLHASASTLAQFDGGSIKDFIDDLGHKIECLANVVVCWIEFEVPMSGRVSKYSNLMCRILDGRSNYSQLVQLVDLYFKVPFVTFTDLADASITARATARAARFSPRLWHRYVSHARSIR